MRAVAVKPLCQRADSVIKASGTIATEVWCGGEQSEIDRANPSLAGKMKKPRAQMIKNVGMKEHDGAAKGASMQARCRRCGGARIMT